MTFERSFILALKVNAVFIVALLLYAGGRKCYAAYLYHKFKTNPTTYVYDDFGKALNCTYYSPYQYQADSVRVYYDSVKAGVSAPLNFDYLPLSITRPVTIIGYQDADSGVVEFIDFEKSCWGYIRGYMSRATMHTAPPSDSLVSRYNNSMEEIGAFQPRYKHSGRTSPYGFYCDCD